MKDKRKLRKADFVTSVFLFALGIWICLESLKMPMKDSFGGVQNVWYVSPALFPILVGLALMALSLFLFVNAAKTVGFRWVIDSAKERLSRAFRKQGVSEGTLRFIGILTVFVAFIFLNIPRIDFFLSSVLFLFVFITMFHLDRHDLLVRFLRFYSIGTALFVLYFLFRLDRVMNNIYYFMTDVLALLFIAAYVAFVVFSIKGDKPLRRKFWLCALTAFIAPVVLCIVFKYFLLVPLPKEGIIVEGVMDLIRYSLK